MTARANFAGDAVDLDQRGLVFLLRDKGAGALHAREHVLLRQLAHGAVHGHARHAELFGQRQLGRDGLTLLPNAGLDGFEDQVFDALKGGNVGFRRHMGFAVWVHLIIALYKIA